MAGMDGAPPTGLAATMPPPVERRGALPWLRANLFSSRLDATLTIVLVVILASAAIVLLRWAFEQARWGVITANLKLFLVGLYPVEEVPRVWLALVVVSALASASGGVYGRAVRTLAVWLAAGQLTVALLMLAAGTELVAVATVAGGGIASIAILLLATRLPPPRRWLVLAWIASAPVTLVLLYGVPGTTLLPVVSTNEWSGLLLTIVLATVSIALSFPFGVALAFGRRSGLPAVRILSTVIIEVVRGVPLVTIIFLADIMLPLLAGDVRIDRIARAIGALTIFTAAYLAENVRGGLQAIPRGQYEAAHAIGLNTFQLNLFIVLPQALRAVIPANVGLFISLLKDTTLVIVVGLLELLGIGRAVLAQPAWLGTSFEVYAFIAIVFFALCYALSQASYRLETELGVGVR
jgi:general L-amino acid transport system permease protein